MNVDGRIVRALLDTGSQINLVGRSFALGMLLFDDKQQNIKGINGRSSTLGAVKLGISVGSHTINDVFRVVTDESVGRFDLFLGSKFFVDNKIIVTCARLEIDISNAHCV